jgi:hypothetical protein
VPALHLSLGSAESSAWLIDFAHRTEAASLLRFSKRCALEARQQRLHWPLTESLWDALVQSGDVVCARSGEGRILGYYAADQFRHLDDESSLAPARAARSVLCNRFKFAEQTVAFGAVALIETRLHNSDLRLRLLRELLRALGYRYRCLFNMVEKSNVEEIDAELREGWRCFHEEDDACYMMLDVAKALRQLASSLLLHMPNMSKPPVKAVQF